MDWLFNDGQPKEAMKAMKCYESSLNHKFSMSSQPSNSLLKVLFRHDKKTMMLDDHRSVHQVCFSLPWSLRCISRINVKIRVSSSLWSRIGSVASCVIIGFSCGCVRYGVLAFRGYLFSRLLCSLWACLLVRLLIVSSCIVDVITDCFFYSSLPPLTPKKG